MFMCRRAGGDRNGRTLFDEEIVRSGSTLETDSAYRPGFWKHPNHKILDATNVPQQYGLARYYLALTADAHVLYRRLFLERKPSADFSWGGHRAGYLFYSHGSAVVYYDIQFEELIGESDNHQRTGMFTMEHEPIVLKNQVFLPIPKEFEREMVPTDRTLKFTIRHQILGVGNDSRWER
jgi:hypothetical protein